MTHLISDLKAARQRNSKRFMLVAASGVLALTAIIGIYDSASTPPIKTVSVTIPPAINPAKVYSCKPETFTVESMHGGKIYRLDIILPHHDCHAYAGPPAPTGTAS